MLNGKVALITGASRGIGRAIAIKFAGLGADIAVVYAGNEERAQEVVAAARALGVRAEALKCDVSDFSAVKSAVDDVKNKLGTVDILVNNAGVTRDGLVMSMKEEVFDAVVDTNLKGAFNMIRHCSPMLIRKKSGKIINISSVAGLIGNPGQANYAASKAGLIGLTKSVARELASRNITCNAIAPGFVRTDMTEDISKDNPLLASIPLPTSPVP